jgi:hypothetical protein
MLEFLAKNILGNMPLVPTNKLFKSPLRLFFKCCGIARVVPIIINGTEAYLDFHIYAILEFDLLVRYLVEKLFQVKPSNGSLDKKLGITASATQSLVPKVPWRSIFPTMTGSRRQSSFPRSFHLGFLVKLNICRQPRSNPSHVPLAFQALFSMVIEIQH